MAWTAGPASARCRVTSGAARDAALRGRGSLLIGVDRETAWHAPRDGRPGRFAVLSDAAIPFRVSVEGPLKPPPRRGAGVVGAGVVGALPKLAALELAGAGPLDAVLPARGAEPCRRHEATARGRRASTARGAAARGASCVRPWDGTTSDVRAAELAPGRDGDGHVLPDRLGQAPRGRDRHRGRRRRPTAARRRQAPCTHRGASAVVCPRPSHAPPRPPDLARASTPRGAGSSSAPDGLGAPGAALPGRLGASRRRARPRSPAGAAPPDRSSPASRGREGAPADSFRRTSSTRPPTSPSPAPEDGTTDRAKQTSPQCQPFRSPAIRAGTLERRGLGWEDLPAVNPKLVTLRISGRG